MFLILFPLFLFASIYTEIVNFYKSYYPNIKIEKITSNKPFPKKYNSLKLMLNPKSNSGIVRVDNKYYYIKIKATLEVFKAVKIIRPNSPILPNVKREKIEFKYLYTKPLDKILPNLVASKIISKNSIITTSNTKIAPAILKNQKVKVKIGSSPIEIISTAKALKDGDIGEVIPIEMNRKIFNAKIIAKGVVKIE